MRKGMCAVVNTKLYRKSIPSERDLNVMGSRLLMVILIAVGIAIGCSPPESEVFLVSEDTLRQAETAHFPYLSTLASAKSGDRNALRKLLNFSGHLDAGGAIGHGMTLVHLASVIGDHDFSLELLKLPNQELIVVGRIFRAGLEYQQRDSKSYHTSASFPKSLSALSETGSGQ